MTSVPGDLGCAAAMFIYKNDGTERDASDAACKVREAEGPVHIGIHREKKDFLNSISNWNRTIDPKNAFLCLYAHMGSPGINCVKEFDENVVSWKELAAALVRGVAYLWLVGCESHSCLADWAPLGYPVHRRLLFTSTSKPWRPLLPCFASEISMSVVFEDQMPARIRSQLKKAGLPELADSLSYYQSESDGSDFMWLEI